MSILSLLGQQFALILILPFPDSLYIPGGTGPVLNKIGEDAQATIEILKLFPNDPVIFYSIVV